MLFQRVEASFAHIDGDRNVGVILRTFFHWESKQSECAAAHANALAAVNRFPNRFVDKERGRIDIHKAARRADLHIFAALWIYGKGERIRGVVGGILIGGKADNRLDGKIAIGLWSDIDAHDGSFKRFYINALCCGEHLPISIHNIDCIFACLYITQREVANLKRIRLFRIQRWARVARQFASLQIVGLQFD